MASVQWQTPISTDDLLQAAQQLERLEFERFLNRLLAIRAQRKAPGTSYPEAELLLEINRGIPANLQNRYNALEQKRQAEMLTDEDYRELLELTDRIEEWQAKRAESLSLLAQRRGVSLGQLLCDLGIQPLPYV